MSDSKDQKAQLCLMFYLCGSVMVNFNLSFLPLEEELYRLFFPFSKKNNSGNGRMSLWNHLLYWSFCIGWEEGERLWPYIFREWDFENSHRRQKKPQSSPKAHVVSLERLESKWILFRLKPNCIQTIRISLPPIQSHAYVSFNFVKLFSLKIQCWSRYTALKFGYVPKSF